MSLCRPSIERWLVTHASCPTCPAPALALVVYEAWYGPTWTCLKCGEEWSPEEIRQRPFMRGWREKNIQAALSRIGRLWELQPQGVWFFDEVSP